MIRQTRQIVVVLATVLTAALYAVLLVVTGLVACGVSGCSGGGFGPSFAPRQAQLGLVLTGLALAPLAMVLVRGRRHRAVGAAGMIVGGSVVAMLLLGLGPDGCPWGQAQARVGSEGFSPGALTCSSDRYAVPPGETP